MLEKLIYEPNHKVIYSYDTIKKESSFANERTKEIMLNSGIQVRTKLPNEMGKNAGKLRIVKLNDPEFHEAYKEYVRTEMDPQKYHWEVEGKA